MTAFKIGDVVEYDYSSDLWRVHDYPEGEMIYCQKLNSKDTFGWLVKEYMRLKTSSSIPPFKIYKDVPNRTLTLVGNLHDFANYREMENLLESAHGENVSWIIDAHELKFEFCLRWINLCSSYLSNCTLLYKPGPFWDALKNDPRYAHSNSREYCPQFKPGQVVEVVGGFTFHQGQWEIVEPDIALPNSYRCKKITPCPDAAVLGYDFPKGYNFPKVGEIVSFHIDNLKLFNGLVLNLQNLSYQDINDINHQNKKETHMFKFFVLFVLSVIAISGLCSLVIQGPYIATPPVVIENHHLDGILVGDLKDGDEVRCTIDALIVDKNKMAWLDRDMPTFNPIKFTPSNEPYLNILKNDGKYYVIVNKNNIVTVDYKDTKRHLLPVTKIIFSSTMEHCQ